MIERRLGILLLSILGLFLTVACDLSTVATTTTAAVASTTTGTPMATFVIAEHATVSVYATQALTNGEAATLAYARDADTGAIRGDGEGQVNFTIVVEEGYRLASIVVTPDSGYKNLKGPSETGNANAYRITRISGDVIVTIVTERSDAADYDPSQATEIVFGASGPVVTANDNGGVAIATGVVTITQSGTYLLSGAASEGAVVVAAPSDGDVTLLLSGLDLASSTLAPIAVLSADNAEVVLVPGTTNTLDDQRATSIASTSTAALYAACDLTLSGTGALVVAAAYQYGISTKDDLTIRDVTLTVVAADTGLRGADSIAIASGVIDITAKAGDGLRTANSDQSDKGVQRGTITIAGGTLTINAGADGIDAAYDVVITGNPVVTIATTATYATGVDTTIATEASTLYLRLSSSLYATNYRYAIAFAATANAGIVWVDGTFAGSAFVGGRTYYYYTFEKPDDATVYTLYRFVAAASDSTTTYAAKTATTTLNAAYDMLAVAANGISGQTISTSWMNYANQTQGGMPPGGGNTNTLAYSAKGIKAADAVTIEGGTIVIRSYDDAIHANDDELLGTGGYGLGLVTIQGGTITVTTKDDGIHGDGDVVIAGGATTVLTSYEGVEGDRVCIEGGTLTVASSDDGLNAMTLVTVSGGIIDVTVGSGDTDAIDSNGGYVQTGGFVVARSALSGGMGGALDTETAVSITGGTFVGIGVSERVAATAGANRSTGTFNLSIGVGTYEVRDASGTAVLTFTVSGTATYSALWISSDQLTAKAVYTLTKNGTTIKTWTQS